MIFSFVIILFSYFWVKVIEKNALSSLKLCKKELLKHSGWGSYLFKWEIALVYQELGLLC